MLPKNQQKRSNIQLLQAIADLNAILKNTVTSDDMAKVFNAVLEGVKKVETRIVDNVAKNKDSLESKIKDIHLELKETEKRMGDMTDEMHTKSMGSLKVAVTQLEKEVKKCMDMMPELPDYSDRFEEIEEKIPTLPPEKLGEDYRNALEALNGDDRLDKSAIRGLEEALEEAVKNGKHVEVKGSSRGLFLSIDGVEKGILQNINLKAGTGMSIAYSQVNGQDTITFNSSGGGSTVETPTGTVNAVNTVFTVTAEPKFVVADGTTYFDGAGYAYSALSITMDVPPSASIRSIY